MIPLHFAYLFGSGLFLILWGIIFFLRKDLRPLLLQIGILFMLLGLICEYFWWTYDWWKPETITNTRIGIEDIIFGFTSSGVSATVYLVVFQKKLSVSSKNKNKKHSYLFWIIFINLFLFTIFFKLGINSFICTMITIASGSVLLLIKRRELLIPAILNGILLMIVVTPIYQIMILLTPHLVNNVWITAKLSGYYFIGVPIEDYFFYFISGVLAFLVYPFLTSSELS